MTRTLIIAALSARAYAADALAAGYKVIAMDAFADEETKQLAQQTIQVRLKNGCFDTDDFLNKIQALACETYLGLVYGSGFEGNIELLNLLAQGHLTKQLPIIGNLPQTVAQIKNAPSFFKVLDDLNIPHPAVKFAPLADANGWLLKAASGTGGAHVQAAKAHAKLEEGHYFQREIAPTPSVLCWPISLLFLADGVRAEVVGFNLQLLAATQQWPYRFGGIVSHYLMSESAQKTLLDAANKLTKYYGLRGLNSLDAILEVDAMLEAEIISERLSVLEINPRLSASVGLYTCKNTHLMTLHMKACLQASKLEYIAHQNSQQAPVTQLMPVNTLLKHSKAHGIFYAPFDVCIKAGMNWPAWVVDIPQVNTRLKKEAPVCTVIASAPTSDLAYQQLVTRLASLAREFSE